MRRNICFVNSVPLFFPNRDWPKRFPNGVRLPKVWRKPSARESGSLLSKRLWGSALGSAPPKASDLYSYFLDTTLARTALTTSNSGVRLF